MRLWESLSFFSASVERLLQRGELPAQRRDLLVEHFDLRQRARGDFLFALELAGELGHLALSGRSTGTRAFGRALQAVALAFGGGERRTQLRELVLEIGLARLSPAPAVR